MKPKRSLAYRLWLERMVKCRKCRRECVRLFAPVIGNVAEHAFQAGYTLAEKHAERLKEAKK